MDSQDETFRAANRAAIAHARRTPGLGRCRPYGQDEAHDDAVRRFRWDPAVRAYLDGKDARRKDRKADDWHPTAEQALLGGAAEFLAGEAELVRRAREWNAGRVDWAAEKPWVREVYDIICCQAAEDGPNVICTCLLLADLIYARFGTRRSTESIREARLRLGELGVLGSTVRGRSRPTIWHVLTRRVRAALASLNPCKQDLPALEGLVCREEQPGFSDEERAVFRDTVQRLRAFDWRDPAAVWVPLWERQARAVPPEADQAALDALLDWEPAPLAA